MPYEYTLPEGYAEEEITGVIAESISRRNVGTSHMRCTNLALSIAWDTYAAIAWGKAQNSEHANEQSTKPRRTHSAALHPDRA
jgi:hypothetical protein